jgi:hypothetical protein
MYFFESTDADVVPFKLKEFTARQFKIFSKYHKPESMRLEITNASTKSFIDYLDKYLLHTLEEVGEAFEEYRRIKIGKSNHYDYHMELVDILMYLGTTLSIVEMNATLYSVVSNEYKSVVDLDLGYLYNSKELPDTTTRLLTAMKYVVDARRCFPERKWHKPIPEVSPAQLNTRIASMVDSLVKAIKIIASMLLSECGFEVDSMIWSKQQYVLNLEKTQPRLGEYPVAEVPEPKLEMSYINGQVCAPMVGVLTVNGEPVKPISENWYTEKFRAVFTYTYGSEKRGELRDTYSDAKADFNAKLKYITKNELDFLIDMRIDKIYVPNKDVLNKRYEKKLD